MKIHQDWYAKRVNRTLDCYTDKCCRDNLGEEKTRNLLVRLVDCFILLVDRGETAIVRRKFLTCMTAFFFKPNAPWTYCIRHITISFAHGKFFLEDQADQSTFNMALPSLSYERLLAVLSFSTTLAEESLRYSMVG